MKEYKHGRSRKQQKIDLNQAYDEEEVRVDDRARERFKRKPYTSYGVTDCLKKWGIDVKGDVANGQESPE